MTSQFPHLEQLIYLNHAAVGPWPRVSAEAVKQFAEENCSFGAANYPEWLKAERRLRKLLADLIGVPSLFDIALLKNTSEALSVVAYGLDWNSGDNIVSSNQEFPSNRIVWESLAQFGVEFRQADLATAASPEDALLAQIDECTRLVAISSIQYASGLRIDLERIGQYCLDHDILFCVDAIQSIGAVNFDAQAIKADFVMADGHKWMLGPEGLALFYCRPELREQLRLNQYGWHMVDPLGDYNSQQWHVTQSARRFECGSPNMIGIHALEASINLLLETGIDDIEQKVLANSRTLFELINQSNHLELITDPSDGRYGGIVTFKPVSGNCEALHQHLMTSKVICALRSGGIRFSPHFCNTQPQLEQAIALAEAFIKNN